jgi:transposase
MVRIDNYRKYCATVSYADFDGGSLRTVARKYDVSKSSLSRWINHDPKCMGVKRPRKIRKCPRRTIAQYVTEYMSCHPYATAMELVSMVYKTLGMSVSEATISRCRKDCNIRYKRVQQTQFAEKVDPQHPFLQNDYYDGAISVDESSFYKAEHPIMGWGIGKDRVGKTAARGRVRVSLLVAIDQKGVVHSEMRKGAYNKETYAKFLQSLPRDRTIIADNVPFHKSENVVNIANERGQTLVYTPPYSPCMNPVEGVFSKTKAAYRRARLRGNVDFRYDVRKALGKITQADCEGYFRGAKRARLVAISNP